LKHWIAATICGSVQTKSFMGVELPGIGLIWFLLALFTASVFVNRVAKLKTCYAASIISVTAILCFVTSKFVWLPLSIQAAGCASLFVYIGYLAKKCNFQIIKSGKIQLCISLLIWGVGILFSFTRGHLNVGKCNFPNGIIDVAGAVAGTVVVLNASYFAERKLKKLTNFLVFFGENSMTVLCAHLFEYMLFPWHIISDSIPNEWISLGVIFILKVLWATVCIILINKIKSYKKERVKCTTM
jgi:fucose 4-O-acetylase-like acetyltransferase